MAGNLVAGGIAAGGAGGGVVSLVLKFLAARSFHGATECHCSCDPCACPIAAVCPVDNPALEPDAEPAEAGAGPASALGWSTALLPVITAVAGAALGGGVARRGTRVRASRGVQAAPLAGVSVGTQTTPEEVYAPIAAPVLNSRFGQDGGSRKSRFA